VHFLLHQQPQTEFALQRFLILMSSRTLITWSADLEFPDFPRFSNTSGGGFQGERAKCHVILQGDLVSGINETDIEGFRMNLPHI